MADTIMSLPANSRLRSFVRSLQTAGQASSRRKIFLCRLSNDQKDTTAASPPILTTNRWADYLVNNVGF